MVTNPDRALERLIEQIENGEREVDESDRQLLLDFSDRLTLLQSEYSNQRHEKLLRGAAQYAVEGKT